MAAYSAVVCFEQLLNQLLSTDHFPKEEVASLHVKVSSLKESIETIFPAPRKESYAAHRLEAEIRDAVYAAQDFIESFLLDDSAASFSLQKLNMDPIVVEAEMLALSIAKSKEYSEPSYDYLIYESGTRNRTMIVVGQEQDRLRVIGQLLSDVGKREVIPIIGMPGIGKTTLARSIYQDSVIRDEFPIRAWVTVAQDYNVGDILGKLLASIESKGQKKVYQGSESTLREKLREVLHSNRYLVVIDDMWDTEVWSKLQLSLPDNENRSRVLMTTRIYNLAESVRSSNFLHVMQPLNEDESWKLLRLRTFGEMPCPPRLVDCGRTIAKNCYGLPLSLTVIGALLSQERKTLEYWNNIKEDTYAATRYAKIEEAYFEILHLIYEHLPPKLKVCFLYMAAFPEDTEVLASKLVKLWVAEGFLMQRSPHENIEQVAEQSLLQLIDRNLVVVHKNSSDGRIKTCGIHDSLRELAQREAAREKFFYSIRKRVATMEEGTWTQRRVSVHRTLLMCHKQVYESTKSITLARTLLYVDPSYPYPLPFCLTFDLLRVFDAFTVFFIEFPREIIKLIHLRYLSFTFNGKLPSSLSNLTNLQVLMVRRQFKIIFVGISFLPEEIWNMSQLRHLMITESELPLPPVAENSSILLSNLQSLLNVSAASCTKKVLQNMPNLKKLGMWTNEAGDVNLHLDQLNKLESFKFTVLNPIPFTKVNFQPRLSFPETLRKLSLSGCGLPWEDMEVIEKLPNLEVLKLRELAFNGDVWCPSYQFEKLKYLLIEYLNLKWLETDGSHFPCLQRLIFRHCYELENIPMEIGDLGSLELIELVDCSPEAVLYAEDIEADQESFGNQCLQVRIKSSWG